MTVTRAAKQSKGNEEKAKKGKKKKKGGGGKIAPLFTLVSPSRSESDEIIDLHEEIIVFAAMCDD